MLWKKIPYAEKMAETLKTHRAGQSPSLASQIKNLSKRVMDTFALMPENSRKVTDLNTWMRPGDNEKIINIVAAISRIRAKYPDYIPSKKDMKTLGFDYVEWNPNIPLSLNIKRNVLINNAINSTTPWVSNMTNRADKMEKNLINLKNAVKNDYWPNVKAFLDAERGE